MMNRKSFLGTLCAAIVAPFILPKLPALPAVVTAPEAPPELVKPSIMINIEPSDRRHQQQIKEAVERFLSRIPNRNLDDL